MLVLRIQSDDKIVLAGLAANVDAADNNYVGDGQFGVAMIRIDEIVGNGFDP